MSILRQIPTILVLALLAAIGYWGHESGWKAPKFTELWGVSPTEKDDWCEGHGVPDSKCIACRPELGGADPKDWCKEHGVPESKCTICHPEILTKGKSDDWCGEHGVPESQCTICNPDVAVKGQSPASESEAKVSLDPAAKPAKSPLTCQTHAMRVQFASAEAVRKVGVKVEAVQERPMPAYVRANGEIEYDPTRVARVSARVSGTVCCVDKEIGQSVKKGDVLALVDAAEVGRAKSALLEAVALVDVKEKALKRIQASAESGFRTQAELQEAEAALREARVRLFNAQQSLINLGLDVRAEDLAKLSEGKLAEHVRLLGLPDAAAKSAHARTLTANLIPVAAPLDGVVIAREVVAGEVVDSSKMLFIVADVRRMWLALDVRLEDAGALALGQTVVFRPDGSPDAAATGQLTWISTAVDEKTRTVKARADFDNPEGRLRAHMFGTARITVREAAKAVAVPNDALHWEGCCHVAFVRAADDVFHVRKVRLGAKTGMFTEILVGLLPGEVVATQGSYVLKSQILKSTLGATCAE
ncbi:MAG: efflux RND transporter periplasmic adaptor subunit [Planctomycetes bacterium]|nr:efflux RND transporter periplasmic adaptor subunit [Planctomycetota bacterium]